MDTEVKKQLLLMVRALYFSMEDEWNCLGKEYGITPAQQHVLYILSTCEGPLSVSEKSFIGCWHITTVTRLVKSLEEKDYIESVYDRSKSKSKFIFLTEKGRDKIELLTEEASKKNSFPFIVEGLSKEKINDFIEIGLDILGEQKGSSFVRWIKHSKTNSNDRWDLLDNMKKVL